MDRAWRQRSTCCVDRALVNGVVLKRPFLQQLDGLVHVLWRTHRAAREPDRLFEEPEDVGRTHRVSPHARKAPMNRKRNHLYEWAFHVYLAWGCMLDVTVIRFNQARTLVWSIQNPDPPWPWLPSRHFQWTACEYLNLRQEKNSLMTNWPLSVCNSGE